MIVADSAARGLAGVRYALYLQQRARLYSNGVYPHPGVYNVSLPLAQPDPAT